RGPPMGDGGGETTRTILDVSMKTPLGPAVPVVFEPTHEQKQATTPMSAKLRHVDPTHEPGVVARAYAALAATRLSPFVSRHVSWKLDPMLLRATRGRLATTLVFPTAVLETTGAKSGARRRNAIIYFHDGDRVTIVASNAGSPRHPSWYHNLRAHPDVRF